MPTPTPRGPNVVPGGQHRPRSSEPSARQSVHQGQTLSFTASATDADLAPETLTFSLDPGAPTGATINRSSGLFLWPTPGVRRQAQTR